ncbi:MAG TPA: hypothetical protein PK198_03955 [Saprospiraceae bacterium]|nr:hypothetical protein [Saprospiraceae bacterium]HRJ14371.1 hypothetical protein [Saprospiraceae bacterium]HRK83063.1 hypothetical protein [Saprospiraceae bacterium]
MEGVISRLKGEISLVFKTLQKATHDPPIPGLADCRHVLLSHRSDFGNSYRWMGGQEPIGGIRIQTVRLNNSLSATVAIQYTDYNPENEENTYWGRNILTMVKVNGIWKIDDVHWR